MLENSSHVYRVNMSAAPILIKVEGRATYLNCAPFGELLDQIIASASTAVAIDFEGCSGMDSTFLGLLAGGAMRFQARTPPGKIIVRHLSARNLELIQNLGLHRVLEIIDPTGELPPSGVIHSLGKTAPVDRAAMIKAHEQLIAANPDNAGRFQDVVDYLNKRARSGES